jgi:DNA modification methylase
VLSVSGGDEDQRLLLLKHEEGYSCGVEEVGIMNALICGDVIDVLRTLPEKSVQTCVTSTPYYGLRDYGTAKWVGGTDESCDHNPARPDGGERSDRTLPLGRGGLYKEVCGKCGALRVDGQIGLESTPEHFVKRLSQVFCEVWRVLKDDGTLWLNIGDSYAANRGYQVPDSKHKDVGNSRGSRVPNGLKPKDLIGIPWMVAFALRSDGWYLRSDIIWNKPNPMTESVKDRPTKCHEYIFLLSKSSRYYYDYKAVLEPAKYDGRKDTRLKGSKKYKDGFAPEGTSEQTMSVKGAERWANKIKIGRTGEAHSGYYNPDGSLRVQFANGVPARNKRTVWTVATKPYKEAHFATFPPALITPCILAGSREGDTVLDPFVGSGTTLLVASQYNRNGIGIDLNQDYIDLAEKRLAA